MAGVPGEDSWEDSKEVNQSILKKINPEYSLRGLMLKLKFQYFGHVMWRDNSLEKTLILGKIEGRRRKEWGWDTWMALLTQWAWVCANSGKYWRTGRSGMLQFMGLQRIGLSDWTTATTYREQWTSWELKRFVLTEKNGQIGGFPSHSQFM